MTQLKCGSYEAGNTWQNTSLQPSLPRAQSQKKSSCTRRAYHCFTRTENADFQTEGEFMLRGGIERYVRTFPEGGFWKAQGLKLCLMGSPFASSLLFTSYTSSNFFTKFYNIAPDLVSWLTALHCSLLCFNCKSLPGEELSFRQAAGAGAREQEPGRNREGGRSSTMVWF